MATTATPRMMQIADDLMHDGAYVAASSVRRLAAERDALMRAVQVVRLTRHIFQYLEQYDPKALEQLHAAVEAVDTEAWLHLRGGA